MGNLDTQARQYYQLPQTYATFMGKRRKVFMLIGKLEHTLLRLQLSSDEEFMNRNNIMSFLSYYFDVLRFKERS